MWGGTEARGWDGSAGGRCKVMTKVWGRDTDSGTTGRVVAIRMGVQGWGHVDDSVGGLGCGFQ